MGPMVSNGPVFSALPAKLLVSLPALSLSLSLSLHVPITWASQILLHTTWSFASLAELFPVKLQIGRHFY